MPTADFQHSAAASWFPGHMLKAQKAMHEALSLVDMAIELVDARAPLSTRNPKFDRILQEKPRLLLANKADLSSRACNQRWQRYFDAAGIPLEFIQAAHLNHPERITAHWRALVLAERQRRGATRPLLRPIRVMIVGIPNIGKSTLINRLRLKNIAKMGPKPGVTRQTQWVPLAGEQVELLDTPGILWPQLKDKAQELLLTALGNISDDATAPVMTACFLIERLRELGLAQAFDALDLPEIPAEAEELLESLARRRGMLLPGGLPKLETAAQTFLKEFRAGKLGHFTLEMPQEAPATPIP